MIESIPGTDTVTSFLFIHASWQLCFFAENQDSKQQGDFCKGYMPYSNCRFVCESPHNIYIDRSVAILSWND